MTQTLHVFSGIALLGGAGMAVLHIWLHLPVARGVLAGGSDSGFAVACTPPWLSLSLVVGCLLFALLANHVQADLTRLAVLLAATLLLLAGLSAGRTLGVGGVRGDLTVTTGWFMLPTQTVNFSIAGVEADVRATQCVPGRSGLSTVTLTCGGQATQFAVGPFVSRPALEVLRTTFGRFPPQGGTATPVQGTAP